MYALDSVLPHNFRYPVFTAYLSDFSQVTVDPLVSINAATQGIRVADKRQQPLIILLSS